MAADGPATLVWNGPGAPAANPSTDGQDLTVVVPSAKLVPGDYIAEALSPGGAVFESYYFRVTAVQ